MRTSTQTGPMVKRLTAATIALLLVACSGTGLVPIDAPTEQLHNLNDYDSDGVIAARDKCAETTLGANIDNYGCGTQFAITEPFKIDIKFAHNSYELPYSAYPEVKKLADFLTRNSDLTVVIEGHTSKVGGEQFNQVLSEKRAEAIVLMLVNQFNIDQPRVSSVGYGFAQLEVEGDSEAAHAANRRIMAELSSTEYADRMKWTIYSVD